MGAATWESLIHTIDSFVALNSETSVIWSWNVLWRRCNSTSLTLYSNSLMNKCKYHSALIKIITNFTYFKVQLSLNHSALIIPLSFSSELSSFIKLNNYYKLMLWIQIKNLKLTGLYDKKSHQQKWLHILYIFFFLWLQNYCRLNQFNRLWQKLKVFAITVLWL